jgi:hypothetical protein
MEEGRKKKIERPINSLTFDNSSSRSLFLKVLFLPKYSHILDYLPLNPVKYFISWLSN